MSTGPEHYKEAEKLLRDAEDTDRDWIMYILAVAQVHATLAHTAAVVDAQLETGKWSPNVQTWRDAVGPGA